MPDGVKLPPEATSLEKTTAVKTDKILAAWRGRPQCETCDIRHLALFSDLVEEDFRRFPLPVDDLEFGPGACPYRQGEPGAAVFTVRAGLVKLVQYLPNGLQRIVRLHRSGDVLGLEASLGHDYQHTAMTVQTALLCRIPAETIRRLSEETPRLSRQLMRRRHQSVTQADDWLTLLSTGSTRARMARLFLYLSGGEETATVQFFNREEVAAILGVTTETASRTVAEFRRQNVIVPLPTNRFRCDAAKLQEIARN